MKALGYPALVVAGVLGGYVLFGGQEAILYPEVIVPAARIERREPDTVRTFVDRVRHVAVGPSQVATAPQGAHSDVTAFCRPVVALRTDTIIRVDTLLLLRSVTHSPGWFTQRDRLTVTGLTNVGDLKAMDYDVRPGFTARAVRDGLQVKYPRTALLRSVGEFSAVALLTWMVVR
jgi:hypothetical protein